MDTLSEFLPFIFIVLFVVISVRRNMKRVQQETEMAKTVLPGRESGEVIEEPEPAPAPSFKSKTKTTTFSSSRKEKETTFPETFSEPILNTDDTEDIQKAIIYSEILNRKDY
jgi:hypothetical protein